MEKNVMMRPMNRNMTCKQTSEAQDSKIRSLLS